MSERFDPQIKQLIPHREPMLLINELLEVGQESSVSRVIIDAETPFADEQGVPAWIGLEYMGQTAALIAGYQQREGLCEPHLGFLMGSRRYKTNVARFVLGHTLRVRCEQGALVGESLATFNCTITDETGGEQLANALLSVYRRPLD